MAEKEGSPPMVDSPPLAISQPKRARNEVSIYMLHSTMLLQLSATMPIGHSNLSYISVLSTSVRRFYNKGSLE